MAEKIIMPQGGQDLKVGTVVCWHKKEGEKASKGELICEVETEKAVFEVNAPCDGYLLKIVKQAGEEAEILSAIGYIGEKGEKIVLDEETQPKNIDTKESSVIHQEKPGKEATGRVRISPKARKIASDHGIDLNLLVSSRSDGKITVEDVQNYISREQPSIRSKGDFGRSIKIGKVRKVTAQRLQRSWQQAPHIFVSVSVDMSNSIVFKGKINKKKESGKVSINDIVIKAVSQVLKDFPNINATYQDEDTITQWDEINIGIAVATDQGLLVPVLENAGDLSLIEISVRVRKLVDAARQGKLLAPQPSRFTISNLGMYDVDSFTAVINPPESAILAVASIRKLPGVDGDGNVAVREMMNMTLSLDHRVGDGLLAAKFLNRVKTLLETPFEL